MTKINFQHIKIFTGVSREAFQICDVRELFADLVYKKLNGIRAHSLAMKIYKSNEETEFCSEELTLIKSVAEHFCVPGFIDGLKEQLERNGDGKDKKSKNV